MVEVGQWVVYPAHGVGQVIAIEPRSSIAGTKLIVVFFPNDKLTLRVPFYHKETLRPLTPKPQLKQALKKLTGQRVRSRKMWHLREGGYRAELNSGDIERLATLVRNLYIGDTEEQSYTERDIFDKAVIRLSDEVAAVMDWSHAETAELIEEALATKKLPKRLEAIV